MELRNTLARTAVCTRGNSARRRPLAAAWATSSQAAPPRPLPPPPSTPPPPPPLLSPTAAAASATAATAAAAARPSPPPLPSPLRALSASATSACPAASAAARSPSSGSSGLGLLSVTLSLRLAALDLRLDRRRCREGGAELVAHAHARLRDAGDAVHARAHAAVRPPRLRGELFRLCVGEHDHVSPRLKRGPHLGGGAPRARLPELQAEGRRPDGVQQAAVDMRVAGHLAAVRAVVEDVKRAVALEAVGEAGEGSAAAARGEEGGAAFGAAFGAAAGAASRAHVSGAEQRVRAAREQRVEERLARAGRPRERRVRQRQRVAAEAAEQLFRGRGLAPPDPHCRGADGRDHCVAGHIRLLAVRLLEKVRGVPEEAGQRRRIIDAEPHEHRTAQAEPCDDLCSGVRVAGEEELGANAPAACAATNHRRWIGQGSHQPLTDQRTAP
mmetsp:Transcript_26778/g.89203  ORF Transcript_26778/g.89203 Transcript_26778/m.89203 type:complete len:443 (+) Transcript_26778:402-1730(+)